MNAPLPPLPPVEPGRYRHHKGNEYELVGVVRHSETLEPMALYRPLDGGDTLWVRPHAMFFETVEVDGRRQPRFERLPEPPPEHPAGPGTALATWHRLVRERDASGLPGLLAEDAVFHSPVVHTPQRGRALVARYLSAAFQVFFTPGFRYVREIAGPNDALLEFETEIDGLQVNGVDLIRWNEAGQIVDFKVMLRPLKAVHLIHQRMAAMLQSPS
jgi:ketosteroid isomerase-like protein